MAITKVTTDVITDLAVTAPKLAADSVITAKIADNAVTAAKIAAGALTDQVAGISSAADATAITIDSSERVGIGTANPDTELTIVGGIKVSQSALTDSITMSVNTSSSYAQTITLDDIGLTFDNNSASRGYRFGNNGSERMRIDSSGKVGIGTASPFGQTQISDTDWSSGAPYGTVLTVTGNNTNDANWGHLMISDSSTGTGNGGMIRFATGSTSSDMNPFAGIDSFTEGSAYGGLKFLTRPNGGTATARMTILSDGNVGIGTDSPQAVLHLKGAGNELRFERTNFDPLQVGIGTANSQNGFHLTNITDSTIPFSLHENAPTNTLVINSSGNVGIGDATPQALLDVGGGYGSNTTVATFAHATDAYIEIENMTTQNGAGIILTNAGTKKWTIQKDTSAHHLTIQDTSGDVMTFLQGGNVGINQDSPTTKLNIIGAKYVLTDSGKATGGIHIQSTPASSLGEYGGAISFAAGNVGAAAIAAVNDGGSDTDSVGLAFITHGSATSTADAIEVARFDETGNFGIGTTSPTGNGNLNVQAHSSSTITSLKLSNSTSGSGANDGFDLISNANIAYVWNRENDSMIFGTNNAQRMSILSDGYTSVNNDGAVASGRAGLHVEHGGLLINGTAANGTDAMGSSSHHPNYWTFIGSGGRSGSRSGSFRIEVPEPTGGATNHAYGGFSVEIYLAGYNGAFCHAMVSGYINSSVNISESAILRSGGSHSLSYGVLSGTSQGFYVDIDIPGYTHSSAYYRITKGGDTSSNHDTDFRNVKAIFT